MKRFGMVIALGTLLPMLALAQADLQPVALVKLVKTEVITVKQLKAQVAKQETQLKRSLTVAERRQVLDAMIDEKLFLQAAERDKITVSDAELNQQIAQARAMVAQAIGRQPTDQEFEKILRDQYGMDMATYRDELKRTLILQKYLIAKKGALFQAAKGPTEEDIRQAYELNAAELTRPAAVCLSMIMVPYGADAAAKVKAKDAAERMLKDIGGDSGRFDSLVMRGQEPSASYRAVTGNYVYKTPDFQKTAGQDFLSVVFALKLNEVSRVIEGPNAYYIVKATEIYAQKTLELTDPYQLGEPGTVRDYITQSLTTQMTSALIEKATKELLTELRAGNPFQVFDNNLNW